MRSKEGLIINSQFGCVCFLYVCVCAHCVRTYIYIKVENSLLDKLCEQLSSVLAALALCDPQRTGYVTQEDLRKVLSCYGMPITDTHFSK